MPPLGPTHKGWKRKDMNLPQVIKILVKLRKNRLDPSWTNLKSLIKYKNNKITLISYIPNNKSCPYLLQEETSCITACHLICTIWTTQEYITVLCESCASLLIIAGQLKSCATSPTTTAQYHIAWSNVQQKVQPETASMNMPGIGLRRDECCRPCLGSCKLFVQDLAPVGGLTTTSKKIDIYCPRPGWLGWKGALNFAIVKGKEKIQI